MNPRLLLVIGAVTALAFGGLLAGYLTRDTGSASGADAPADGVIAQQTGLKGARIAPGIRAPEFDLRDENGDRLTMRDLRGKPLIVTFLYSTCEDTCPSTAQQIRGALDEFGRDIPAVAISVDPKQDDEESARRFLAEQNMTGRMRFALGGREQLAPLWRAYGTSPQTVQEDHMARAVLIDSRGYQRVGFPMNETSPDMIAHDLAVIAREG